MSVSLFLCRTHNSLFLPENMARLSETFSRVYEVMDVEKNVVLGMRNSVVPNPVCVGQPVQLPNLYSFNM